MLLGESAEGGIYDLRMDVTSTSNTWETAKAELESARIRGVELERKVRKMEGRSVVLVLAIHDAQQEHQRQLKQDGSGNENGRAIITKRWVAKACNRIY